MAIIPIILILLFKKLVKAETHPCLKAVSTVHESTLLLQQLDIISVPLITSEPLGPLRPQHSYYNIKQEIVSK